MAKKRGDGDTVVIKKYANRRLYNTDTSAYVTLDDLGQMVREGVDFRVHDAKTGQDLTRTVLTQIIVEEEQKGQNLLPIGFLRQVIGMYGDNMKWMLPQFLESSMSWYCENQERLRQQLGGPFGGVFPASLDDMQRRNVEMFEQAMRMFNPMATGQPESQEPGATAPEGESDEPTAADADTGTTDSDAAEDEGRRRRRQASDEASIEELRQELAAMQRRLNRLAGKDGDD